MTAWATRISVTFMMMTVMVEKEVQLIISSSGAAKRRLYRLIAAKSLGQKP